MTFKDFRPQDIPLSITDKQLSKIANTVDRFLKRQQSSLLRDLAPFQIRSLAFMITEFAEDTYFEIGMWESIEKHNLNLFGNPLPFSKPELEEHNDFPFDEYRLSHFLWNAIMIVKEFYFSPYHADLLKIAEKLSHLLEGKFKKIKGQSTIKKFLTTPNTSGSIVKKKLVWAGLRSYLFRDLCQQYLVEKEADTLDYGEKIGYWDDFINQQCTLWSGMGVLDIIPNTLDITPTQKAEISSWYERHLAFYKIEEIKNGQVTLRNLIIDKKYVVYDGINLDSFKAGQYLYASIVPFNNKWYWSGSQTPLRFKDEKEDQFKTIKNKFIHKSPSIIYRYDKDRLEKAIHNMENYRKYFIEFHGNDFTIFQTGKEAAQASIDKLRYQQKEVLGVEGYEKQRTVFEQLEKNMSSNHPPDFLNTKDGVCVFFHPIIGEQMMTGFNVFFSGLKKDGLALNEEEKRALYDCIQDDSVSSALILRMIEHCNTKKSIAESFFLKKRPPYWLDYLLRKYKGKDYRNQYPSLVVMNDEETAELKKQYT